MFSPTVDANAAAGAALPPLQEGIRLAWPIMCNRYTTEDAARLQTYLRDRCQSTDILKNLGQVAGINEAAVFGAGGEAAVSAAVAQREGAARQRLDAELAAKKEAARALLAADKVDDENLKLSSAARVARVAATVADGGFLETTMTLACASSGGTTELTLETHRLAAVVIGPFLAQIEAAAAAGSVPAMRKALNEGIILLNESYRAGREAHFFGVLELYRHLFVRLYGLGTSAAVAGIGSSRAERDAVSAALDGGAVAYEKQLRADLHEMRQQRQNTEQLAACSRSTTRLVQEYCVFFSLTMAVADGTARNYYAMAASLLPAGGAIYGAARFPEARQCIFQRGHATPIQVKSVRNPVSGQMVEAVTPGFSADAISSDRVMPTTTTGRLPSVTAVLTTVIAPARSIAVFIIFAAVASLPIASALDVAVTVSEVQALYADCPVLTGLVTAMWRGRLGEVWERAREAATVHLSHREPLLPAQSLQALLSTVQESLCYQYAGSRSTLDLGEAAANLRLGGGAVELQSVLEPLILSGRLPMRINAVDQRLTQVVLPTVSDPGAVAEQSLDNCRLGIAEMELSLRRLAVQRRLTHPTFDCVMPRSTGR